MRWDDSRFVPALLAADRLNGVFGDLVGAGESCIQITGGGFLLLHNDLSAKHRLSTLMTILQASPGASGATIIRAETAEPTATAAASRALNHIHPSVGVVKCNAMLAPLSANTPMLIIGMASGRSICSR